MNIDNAGNVGIGTAYSPKFTITNNGSYYFNNAPWITFLHPYYFKYKNLQDLIDLRERR